MAFVCTAGLSRTLRLTTPVHFPARVPRNNDDHGNGYGGRCETFRPTTIDVHRQKSVARAFSCPHPPRYDFHGPVLVLNAMGVRRQRTSRSTSVGRAPLARSFPNKITVFLSQ